VQEQIMEHISYWKRAWSTWLLAEWILWFSSENAAKPGHRFPDDTVSPGPNGTKLRKGISRKTLLT
jgi:hypothetical protein